MVDGGNLRHASVLRVALIGPCPHTWTDMGNAHGIGQDIIMQRWWLFEVGCLEEDSRLTS